MTLKYEIKNQVLHPVGRIPATVELSRNVVFLDLSFDAEWSGAAVTVLFSNDFVENGKAYQQIWNNEPVTVPPEVLETGMLRIGCVGLMDGGETRITTARMDRGVQIIRCGGIIGVDSAGQTPELWEQILASMGQLGDLQTDDKSSLVAAINEVLSKAGGGSGSVDPADIAKAVEDYMAANPIQETDPNVPAWAKAPEKPTYTAEEVHALPDTYTPPVDATLSEISTNPVQNKAITAKLSEVEAIAKGRATGYVFDTETDMRTWIAANASVLNIGDNLYIRATDVPDYWWDGTAAQPLETQRVDLTEYAKKSEVPVIDPTVTQSGQAADAAAVREELSSLSGKIANQTEPEYGDIVKFFIIGTIPTSKDEGDLPVNVLYVSKTQRFEAHATLKVQGNSSKNFPKKNFTLKLYSDEARSEKLKIDLMGWGKQYKYVLKANWIDITHSRNIVGARLWRQICETRKDSLPVLLQESPRIGCVDGFPIKVYVNGTYYGRYSWNIPKDTWAFNMDDGLDEHTVLCGESNDEGTSSVYAQSSDTIDGTYWTDEIHDTVPDSVVTAFNRVLKFVNESTDDEFMAGIDDYIDIQSLIDYWCFQVLFGNTDAYGKNQLLITYDLNKWFIHAYDMDQFCGLDWNGNLAYAYDSDHPIIVAQYNNLILKLIRNFPNEITARYQELRNSVLSEENVINEFERWTDICPPYLVEEDYAVTTAGGAFTGIPSATSNNIQQIREWIIKRFALFDTLAPNFGIISGGEGDTATYTITNTLSNCTNSNAATSITGGSAYNATITPLANHTLASVSCTMGGVEVPVSDGIISIASVTGNIEITATATIETSAVSLVSSSADMILRTNKMGTENATLSDGVWTFKPSYAYDAFILSRKMLKWSEVNGKTLDYSLTGYWEDTYNGSGSSMQFIVGFTPNGETNIEDVIDNPAPRKAIYPSFSIEPTTVSNTVTLTSSVFNTEASVGITDDSNFIVGFVSKHASCHFYLTDIVVTIK